MDEPQTPPPAAPVPPEKHTRARVLIALGVVFFLAGAATGLWWHYDGQWRESTDDAYVQGNLVQLTPQIPGIVVRLNADDTALVREGDPVVELDRADTQTALAQAKASLAQTTRRVHELFANVDSLRATVSLREADLEQAREDLARRTGLPDSGALSDEELKHARTAVQTAAAAVQVARQQLAASHALISQTTMTDHPDIALASAQLRSAYLAANRTSLVAPVTGYVAQRSVQLGQQIAPGKPLLAIIPLTDVWVDANFKETELEHVRIGQPVTLIADLYGGNVTYHGRVEGLAPGTGSAFALLPPQNASGNWIKIVQRLPVRIELEPRELMTHPLRIGLSMNVRVDTHDRSGAMLATVPSIHPVAKTDVYEGTLADSDRLAREIVHANLGRPAGNSRLAQE
jgi:membrane fusion protein (multidrug efflux system)